MGYIIRKARLILAHGFEGQNDNTVEDQKMALLLLLLVVVFLFVCLFVCLFYKIR